MMRVIITGGRNYSDVKKVNQVLDFLNPTYVIHGGCSGADNLCRLWAMENHKVQIEYPADWETFGNSAGPIRNKKMVKANHDADLLLAFPGGKGTEHCISEAEKVGLLVLRVNSPK